MSLYDDLGVPKDAAPADIKRAHRRRVRAAHPDAGGNREEFERVQHAYAILIDDSKRERYDRTGEDQDHKNVRFDHIAQIIQKAFDTAVAESIHRLELVDIVGAMRSHIAREKTANQAEINVAKELKRNLETCIKRLRTKGAGPDIIGNVLKGRLRDTERQIELIKLRASHIKEAMEFAERYSWEVDSPASFVSFSTAGTASSSSTWEC